MIAIKTWRVYGGDVWQDFIHTYEYVVPNHTMWSGKIVMAAIQIVIQQFIYIT